MHAFPNKSSLDILVRGGHSGSDHKQSYDHENHVFTSFLNKGHHNQALHINTQEMYIHKVIIPYLLACVHRYAYVYITESCAYAVSPLMEETEERVMLL